MTGVSDSVTMGESARDGTTPTRAGLSCDQIETDWPDSYNADYWVYPGEDTTAEPELTTCFFDNHVEVFAYSGAEETWTVPDGVGYVTIKAWGGGGGGSYLGDGYGWGYSGGGGGYAEATLAVASGDELAVVVGRGGKKGGHNGTYTWTDGDDPELMGGGGQGAPVSGGGGGDVGSGAGGGFSGVFSGTSAIANALAIAGGGGGAGRNYAGGGGGGTSGTDGDGGVGVYGGGGGTQSGGGSPGTGTTCKSNGLSTSGYGAALYGGSGCWYGSGASGGGGGGGGYYGGGGGGTMGLGLGGGGGAGGSGYTHPDALDSALTSGSTSLTENTSASVANGADADYVSGVGEGGGTSTAGGDGYVVIRY